MNTVSPTTAKTTKGHVLTALRDVNDAEGVTRFRPRCSCGWYSDVWVGRDTAIELGDEHLAANTRPLGRLRADVIQLVEPAEPTAADYAAGLRAMATMVETHPELATDHNFRSGMRYMLFPVTTRQAVQAYARAGLDAGGKVLKHQGDKYAGVDVHFGPVMAHVYVEREELCERVVTGVREVTEDVPDPEALAAVPIVAVTKTVEDVSWVCRPILAGGEL